MIRLDAPKRYKDQPTAAPQAQNPKGGAYYTSEGGLQARLLALFRFVAPPSSLARFVDSAGQRPYLTVIQNSC
jgi:hypothetical protein